MSKREQQGERRGKTTRTYELHILESMSIFEA